MKPNQITNATMNPNRPMTANQAFWVHRFAPHMEGKELTTAQASAIIEAFSGLPLEKEGGRS